MSFNDKIETILKNHFVFLKSQTFKFDLYEDLENNFFLPQII